MRLSINLFCLVLIAGCQPGSAPGESSSSDAFAVVAEADRRAERDLWPGFDPRVIPVAIYDGERTLLFRHPAPPAGFQSVPGHDEVWSFPGRYPDVTANSYAEIGGASTATLMPPTGATSLMERAGVLIHEAFHVHQRQHHPAWQANEVELFTYPVDNAELLALRRMETETLRRALVANETKQTACWAGAALAFRAKRFAGLPAGASDYERGAEWFEGLANYVEGRATALPDSAVLPESGFPPEAVRQRSYVTGTAFARLLDRFFPDWRTFLQQNDSVPLDGLLSDVLGGLETGHAECDLTPSERYRIQVAAASDVDALRTRRVDRRTAFDDQPGWRLIVEAPETPLFPRGFDPLNVLRLGAGEVLHTRWLALGNEAGTVEVIGHSALTDAAGPHPLFNGVRRLEVAGLADEPRLNEANGAVTVHGDGISAELLAGIVERTGQTITVRLSSRQ